MTDKTNFHAILATALDPEGDPELGCRPYSGFSLCGEPITAPDLLLIARDNSVLRSQLRTMHEATANMLENLGVLGKQELSSTDEMALAKAIIAKQLEAGHISEVITENGEVYFCRAE